MTAALFTGTATLTAAQDDTSLVWPDAIPGMSETEGELTFGLWYSEAEQLALTAGITQHRIGGTDDTMRLEVGLSEFTQSAHATFTDPDFYEGPFSRRIALSIRSSGPNATQHGDYTFTEAEASLGFGRRLNERTAFSFGGGVTQYWLDESDRLPAFLSDYVAKTGEEITDGFVYGNLVWNDQTEDGWQRSGAKLRAATQLGYAEKTGYATLYLTGEHRTPMGATIELRTHGAVGIGGTLSDGPYPVMRNFVGGGATSLRGFSEGTLGPRSDVPGESDPAYPGGRLSVLAGLEARTPLDAAERIFAIGFFDIGNVYATPQDYEASSLRSSVGIGVGWESPLGPLSVFVSEPVLKEDGDDLSALQFQLGLRL